VRRQGQLCLQSEQQSGQLSCNASSVAAKNTFRGAIMPDEIEVEAVLEECRALIKQIVANLSGEKPFADETSATELLSYLERAASALKKSVSRS
jgi:hypothetical protein